MDKEFIIWMLIFSVIGFAVAVTMLYYIWFVTPPAWYVQVIGTIILGGVGFFCGRSLWLNFIRPTIYRLKDKFKKKSE